MDNGRICAEPRQSQNPDLCTGTHLFPVLAFLGELHSALQGQPLSDQMVVDQIKDAPWKQIGRDIEVAGISCTELQRIDSKAVLGYVCIGG